MATIICKKVMKNLLTRIGKTGKQTGGQVDRQTDKQTGRHTDKKRNRDKQSGIQIQEIPLELGLSWCAKRKILTKKQVKTYNFGCLAVRFYKYQQIFQCFYF